MIIYEGTENIPFFSQIIRDKKFMLLALFSTIGALFLLLSIFMKSDDSSSSFLSIHSF